MRMSTLLAAAAASSLLISPALANPATPLSLSNASNVKASTSAKKSNHLDGAVAIGGLVGVMILAIPIVAAINGDDSDSN